MPLYFFAVGNNPDDTGTDFDNDDAAKAAAIQTCGGMIRDVEGAGLWRGDDWTMQVTDHTGREVATLRFSGTNP